MYVWETGETKTKGGEWYLTYCTVGSVCNKLVLFQSDRFAEGTLSDSVDGRDSEAVNLIIREVVHNQCCGGCALSDFGPTLLHQWDMKRGGGGVEGITRDAANIILWAQHVIVIIHNKAPCNHHETIVWLSCDYHVTLYSTDLMSWWLLHNVMLQVTVAMTLRGYPWQQSRNGAQGHHLNLCWWPRNVCTGHNTHTWSTQRYHKCFHQWRQGSRV